MEAVQDQYRSATRGNHMSIDVTELRLDVEHIAELVEALQKSSETDSALPQEQINRLRHRLRVMLQDLDSVEQENAA